jgi:hypothetical protein
MHSIAPQDDMVSAKSPPLFGAHSPPLGAWEIRDVWDDNLEEEMENIRETVANYPYVAMVSVWCARIGLRAPLNVCVYMHPVVYVCTWILYAC